MKLSRKVWILASIILIGALIAGCSNSSSGGAGGAGTQSTIALSDLSIGLSMQTMGGPYFVAQSNALERLCKEKGITFYSVDAGGNMTKQLSDIEDLLARDIDVLVINPTDPKGLIPITETATAQGVSVFIMDNSIDLAASYVSMIQSNNLDLGELTGVWFAQQMGNQEIRLGVLSGNQGNLLGVDRRIGVVKGIVEEQLRARNSTNFRIVTQGWGNWSQEGGLAAAEDMLQAAPNMNALVAENDSMALGALMAIESAGRASQITVFTPADGQKEALELIKAGRYGATGLNDPAAVAALTLDTIISYVSGNPVQKLINTVPAVITRDNVDQYYNPNSDF
ncbi:MAG: substrate-binding domain-containing protein [Treponema sp.]|jgi:ribose transport system substrate-binding protein|nr:substrate-binding domain-containing protein [Treponema sp.]